MIVLQKLKLPTNGDFIVHNSSEITEQKYLLRECIFKVLFLAIMLSVECVPYFCHINHKLLALRPELI